LSGNPRRKSWDRKHLLTPKKPANEGHSVAKYKKQKIQVGKGDIFEFELAERTFAYGQIVKSGDVIYVIVFNDIYTNKERDIDSQNLTEIALCGWTLDSRIYHGMWKIVGNAPLPDDVPRPCYKVGNGGIFWVETFDGVLKRPASQKDCRSLDYRTTIAPIRFEKALAAIHGLHEWDIAFEKMCVEYARERERAC